MLPNVLSPFKASQIGLRSFSMWAKIIKQPKEMQDLLDQIKKEKSLYNKDLTRHVPLPAQETICVLLHELIHRAETMHDTPLMKQLNLLKRTQYRSLLGLQYPFKNVSIQTYKNILYSECDWAKIGVPEHYPFSFEKYLLYMLAFPCDWRYTFCCLDNEVNGIVETILNTGHQFPSKDARYNAYGALNYTAWNALHSPPGSGLKTASEILDSYRRSTPWYHNSKYQYHYPSKALISEYLFEYCDLSSGSMPRIGR